MPEMETAKNQEKILLWMYVEDSFRIRIADLGRGVLKSGEDGQGKRGWTLLTDGSRIIKLDFRIILTPTPKLCIEYSRGPEHPLRRQEIGLFAHKHGFGLRPYFKRGTRRCGTLYMRMDAFWFSSREEQRLKYRSSNKKPKSAVGLLMLRKERSEKIQDIGTRVRRLFYRDRPTKRVLSVIRWGKRWNRPGEYDPCHKITA